MVENTTEILLSTFDSFDMEKSPVGTANIIGAVTLAAILFLCLSGNALVCYCGLKSTRGQAMNYFIVNLSFAEMLLAFFVVPLRIYRQVAANSTIFVNNANLCRLLQYFETVALAVVNLSLVLIAIDRYLALFLAPATKITVKKSKYLMVVSWCFPMLLTSPIFLDIFGDTSVRTRGVFLECAAFKFKHLNKLYPLFQTTLFGLLPLVFLSGIYFLMIGRVLKIDMARKDRKSPCGTSRDAIPVAKRRALVMNFIVSFLFLFCWSPLITLHTLVLAKGNSNTSEKELYNLLSYVALANLSFNPLVYCFFDSVFRSHVFCCFDRDVTPKSKEPKYGSLSELTVSKIGGDRRTGADKEPLLTMNAAQAPVKQALFSREKLAKLVCNTRRYRSLGHSRCSEI